MSPYHDSTSSRMKFCLRCNQYLTRNALCVECEDWCEYNSARYQSFYDGRKKIEIFFDPPITMGEMEYRAGMVKPRHLLPIKA